MKKKNFSNKILNEISKISVLKKSWHSLLLIICIYLFYLHNIILNNYIYSVKEYDHGLNMATRGTSNIKLDIKIDIKMNEIETLNWIY